MKSIIKHSLFCILIAIFPIHIFANETDTVPPTPVGNIGGKIEIDHIKTKNKRDISEPLVAYYEDYFIDVEFNENLGVVTIEIIDSNNIVVICQQHDTSVETGCCLPVPSSSGCFSINIYGNDYWGRGYFCH